MMVNANARLAAYLCEAAGNSVSTRPDLPLGHLRRFVERRRRALHAAISATSRS